jgi:hypothetical protein
MGIRTIVIDGIKPLLPRGWQFIPYQSNVDTLEPRKPVVMLKLQEFSRAAAAPGGALTVSYILTIAVPGTDPEPVENDLDDKIIDLVHAIEGVPNLKWTEAKRVVVGAANQGYDITIELTTKKE